MNNMKQASRRISLKAKLLSGVCIGALLYGTAAQAMPGGLLDGGDTGDVLPLVTELVSKRFTYDADGNHTETTSLGGMEMKEHDILGRLIRYAGPHGVEEYTYLGASHKRYSIKRTPAGGGAPELTTFLYDGDNVIAEYTGEDRVLSRTYVTPELDGNLSMTVHNGPDVGTYYYTQDRIDSIRTVTDSAGAVRNLHDYTAFGEPYNSTVTLDQRYGFTGREINPLSGDMHYRYRNYNPARGRFDRRDPIGYRGGVNQYAYVENMPNGYIDPYGLKLRVTGDDPFRKKVLDALNEMCPGLTMDANGNISMNYCPRPDDELCTEWYKIIHNNRDNVIRPGRAGDEGPAAAHHSRDGYIQSDGSKGPGSNTEVHIQNQPHHIDGKDQFDVKATLILPWSILLTHELGHVYPINQGTHPDPDIDEQGAEENSVKRENQGWGKIGSKHPRKRY